MSDDGRDDDLVGERADEHEPKTRSPDGDRVTPSATSVTTPANSLPGMKGSGADLVRVGHDEHVGEIHGADVDAHPHLPGASSGAGTSAISTTSGPP